MAGLIEALHILDERNNAIVSHIYTGRPPSLPTVLPIYLSHAVPRPPLIYLQSTNPPTLLFSLRHDTLLFLATASQEIEPLVVLEFLHRVVDALEEFLGAPLVSVKVEQNYEVVAQVLHEMCDSGIVATTEPNALREVVEVEGWMDRFLGSISLPSNPNFTSSFSKTPSTVPIAPSLPWRRANVKHTTPELFCDIVESLTMTLAPSGRPLAAFAHGTVAFTSKVSGIPDVLVTLSSASGKHAVEKTLDLPVFHPCVRLQRWMERPGELSFIPPDGKFVLASYSVDLLGDISHTPMSSPSPVKLPVSVSIKTGLGPTGADFEVQLTLTKSFLSTPTTSRPGRPIGQQQPQVPTLEDLSIRIPIPEGVKNMPEIRPSRGDASFHPVDHHVDWRIPAKDLSSSPGVLSLRCTIQGALTEEDEDEEDEDASTNGLYDFDGTYQKSLRVPDDVRDPEKDGGKIAANSMLMPGSVLVSFSVKGWLASGLKVDSIILDPRKSKGVGEGVKPFKGVKYLTISKDGMELRC